MNSEHNLKIIFMGTPEFAVPSLQILVENGYNIVGVITAPDKPSGRGLQLNESAVKKYAVSQNLNILQPTNLKDEQFLVELKALKADLQIVVAFRMLPEAVWNMPPKGTFNLHASLLPNYRGAAPINWAIMNGETETGVTTFFLQHEIDTGDIILQEKEPISKADTVGDLYPRLMEKGYKAVLKTVEMIEKNQNITQPQILTGKEKNAPKLFKETCQIDWSHSAENIYNFIRGLSPYPSAWTVLDGKVLKIYKSEYLIKPHTNIVGTFFSDTKTHISFYCADGIVKILELQLEGKKRMTTEEFLRGYKNL